MTFSSPLIFVMTLRKLSTLRPALLKRALVAPTSARLSITQSVDKNSSPAFWAKLSAKFSAFTASGLKLISPVGLASVGASCIACCSLLFSSGRFTPDCCNKLRLEASSNKVDKMCIPSIAVWSLPIARDWASERACCNRFVNFSKRILVIPHNKLCT